MEENLKQYSLLNLGKSVLRIAFYGPESTGKTTLARQLAADFDTVWAPEFARDYLQEKWDEKGELCQPDDLLPIAVGQTQLENQKLQEARRFLFCDTTVLVTKVFGELYYGAVDPMLEKAVKKHKYDLIFLTDIDVPWEPDDLRDRPHNRAETLQFFEEQLIRYQKPYIKLSGDIATRVALVKQLILDLEKALQWGFTSHDFLQIQARNMDWDVLRYQFSILKNGLPKIQLERAATIDDGIQALSEEEARYYATYFDQKKETYCLKKFVPASGAASRMFKFLNEFLHDFKPGKDTINSYINHAKNKDLALFLIALEKFPFFKEVTETTRTLYPSFNSLSTDEKHYYFIKTLMTAPQFDFANKPKGVLPFHQQGGASITPIEEHLLECALYAHADGKSKVHFTVSEEYQSQFESIVETVKPKIEATHEVFIQVNYSYQDKATDVIALTPDGKPFRDKHDAIVFRPGGHGALIQNMNCLNADIVFVKNIDNVAHNYTTQIALYKKALGGILLQVQETVFRYLNYLHQDQVTIEMLHEIAQFVSQKLLMEISEDFPKYTRESKIEYLMEALNRPIRVCGMVKNEGEPGGGPFWVRDQKGRVFLQIIESSQIEKNQRFIMEQATHFNPVDLVCGIRDFQGRNFDLTRFVDPHTGFIVEKNKDGRPLKAFELPGLWNGAMAKWITLFVEVPLETFNPVKTVNDLLKPAHQPRS
jgi:nicotinamide riboside kinase